MGEKARTVRTESAATWKKKKSQFKEEWHSERDLLVGGNSSGPSSTICVALETASLQTRLSLHARCVVSGALQCFRLLTVFYLRPSASAALESGTLAGISNFRH